MFTQKGGIPSPLVLLSLPMCTKLTRSNTKKFDTSDDMLSSDNNWDVEINTTDFAAQHLGQL